MVRIPIPSSITLVINVCMFSCFSVGLQIKMEVTNTGSLKHVLE